MFADDYIMRQIEGLSRMLARVLFDRDMESEELHLDEDGTLSGSDVLAYRLKKLLHERKINEAENLLFETLEASPLPSYGRTALDFYREISTLSDESWRPPISPARRLPTACGKYSVCWSFPRKWNDGNGRIEP